MIHCNQVCMYNFPDNGCLKPASAVCPMSNIARDTNVLNNADRIRSMTDEELAVFLECFGVCRYCPEYEEASFVEYGIPDCDGDCEQHILDWLKQPYKEET